MGSVDPRDLLDNAQVLDKLLNGDAESVAGRLNKVLKSWAGIVADATRIIESARQNLIPLSRQYMTLVAAQADIANIPAGSTTFVRSPDDTALALEYINDGGTLKPTGRKMPSQESLDIVSAYYQIFEKYFSQNGSGNLYEWYDKEQENLIAFMDSAGQLFLPGFDNKPVQSLKSDVDNVKKVIGGNDAPAILSLSDAQNGLLGFMDDAGGYYLPGMGNETLQKYVQDTRKRVDRMYRSRHAYNAVTDFAIDNNGLVDCQPAAQVAINFVSSLPGGGSIYFPRGVYRLHKDLVPKSNVTIIMPPSGARFLPINKAGCFTKPWTDKSYIENAHFIDVEIDGSEHSVYSHAIKGYYIQYFRHCLWLRGYVHDTSATGVGIDFPDGSFILDLVTENCGRLATLGRAGSSGIGIGTGVLQNEPLIISRTINRRNKNFGIFFEQQHDDAAQYQSRQIIVSESIMTGNGMGFGDCGIGGLTLTGCQINDNLNEGVLMSSGTLTVNDGRPQPGNDGIIANCQILRNGSHGINYSALRTMTAGGYSFTGNHISGNAGNGVNLEAKSDYTIPDMNIADNTMKENTGHAIAVASGAWTDLDITGNRALRNGGNIRVDGDIADASIGGNKLRSKNAAPAISGPGAMNKIDIAENQYIGTSIKPVDLTGIQNNVTYGRNPGF